MLKVNATIIPSLILTFLFCATVNAAVYTNLSDDQAEINDSDDVTLTNTADTAFSKNLATTANLVKDGANMQTLSGNVTIGGTTTISAGTLNISGTNNDAAPVFNSTGAVSVGEGAKLKFTNAVPHMTSALSVNVNGTLEFDTNYVPSNPGDFKTVHSAANAVTQGQAVTLTGTGTWLKSGTGVLALASGSSTFQISLSKGAVIDVQAGRMVNGGWTIDWTNNLADLNIGANGTFDIWNQNLTVGAVTGSGTLSSDTTETGNITLTVGEGDASGEFTGTLDVQTAGNSSGRGKMTLSFTKNGSGTQTFSGTAKYNGATTINGGTLEFKGPNAKIGTGIVMNNGTLALNDTVQTLTDLVGSGNITGTADLTLNTTGTKHLYYNGSIDIGSSAIIKTGTGRTCLNKNMAAAYSFGGFLLKGGQLCLPSAYSSTTPVTLEGGTLQRNGDSTSGDGASTTTTLANPIYVTSTGGGLMAGWGGNLNLTGSIFDAAGQTGGNLSIMKDSGAVQLSGDGVVNLTGFLDVRTGASLILDKATTFGGLMGGGNATANGALTLNVAADSAPSFAGTLGGFLVKTGAGTQTITGTVNAATTISEGVLSLSGPTAQIGAQLITNNATLALNDATPTISQNITGSGIVTGDADLKLGGSFTIAHRFDLKGSLVKVDGSRLLLNKSTAANVKVAGFVCQGGYLCLPSAYSSETPITLQGGVLQRNGEGSGENGSTTTTLANPFFVTSTGGGLMAGWSGVLNLTGDISDAAGQTGGTLTIKKDSGHVEFTGDGTINISGFLNVEQQNTPTTNNLVITKNTQFGGLTGVGYVQNDGVMTLNVAEGKTATYDGVLSGSGTVVKTGLGTQIFTKGQAGTTMIQTGALDLAPNGTPAQFENLNITKGAQLAVELKSDTEYGMFSLTSLPTFNADAGFLGLNFLDGYYPTSTSQTYEISKSLPFLTESTDLEGWLLDGLRHEWNLNWVAGDNTLFLSRDASAIPEPGTWVLALLGMVGLCFMRRKSRA